MVVLSLLPITRTLTWSSSCVDGDALVSQTSSLGHVLGLLVQKPTTEVRVKAGVKLLELNELSEVLNVVIGAFAF